MPPVPTTKACFCCLCGSERQASAITTALSPLSTTLITAILNNAVQVSGLVSVSSMLAPPFVVGEAKLPGAAYGELRAPERPLRPA